MTDRPEMPAGAREDKVDSWLNSWSPYNPRKQSRRGLEPVEIEESKIRKIAFRIFFAAFVAFLVWAFWAPIDAGVTAPGQVIVSGYRQAIQHPTGGVVGEIRVTEGSEVKAGDVLIKVNPINSEANLSQIELEYINALVNEARLKAERLGTSIQWPRELDNIPSKSLINEAKAIQVQLFNARRSEFVKTVAARKKQLVSLTEEQQNLEQLAAEGYVPKASAAQAMRIRLETETQLNAFETSYLKQVETELADIQRVRDALQLRYAAAINDLKYAEIKSPTSGTIVGLKVNTIGAVISPGQLLAEVLPNDGKLQVDVKLPATAIDVVTQGLVVDLAFEAFNSATTPKVPGVVTLVGVDLVMPDPNKPGEPDQEYYKVLVDATPEGLKMLGDLKIQPGMPVTVVVKTGERNFISYVMKPITDRLLWAFKN